MKLVVVVVRRTFFDVMNFLCLLFESVCLEMRVTDMGSFCGFKQLRSDNSSLLGTLWQKGGVSDTLVVFLCTVGDFFEIIWHKHTLTVQGEPTDSCIS